MEYSLRRAHAADEPLLWDMLYHAAHLHEDSATSAQAARDHPFLAAFVEGWGKPGDLGIVAGAAGRPMGAAWLRVLVGVPYRYPNVLATTPELAVAVLPEYAGRGIGTQLITQLIDAARDTHDAVVVSVRADNPARRLYVRLGFETVSAVTNRVGGTSFVMLHQLTRRRDDATIVGF